MTTRTMPLSYLTAGLPMKLVPSVLFGGGGGFLLGDAVGGVGGGVAGALAGMVVGIVGIIFTAIVNMRKQTTDAHKQNTDSAIAIDKERDAILERSAQVHAQEVRVLNEQHARDKELTAREKDFLQRQVIYHEQVELVTRQRLHEMVGEVQRGVTHIALLELACKEKKFEPGVPAFEVKSFADIVKMYPLPPAVTNNPHPLS